MPISTDPRFKGGQYPLGRYVEDFEFVDGLGDLDVYNGRFAATPDFPQGTYAYYVTIDDTGAAAFPYILAGQFYGSVTGGTAQAISSAAQDYFANGDTASGTSSIASANSLFSSWLTKTQNAQVTSGFDPSAGPSQTWPTNVPAGVHVSGGSSSSVPVDTQRIRYTDSTVYVNATGLAERDGTLVRSAAAGRRLWKLSIQPKRSNPTSESSGCRDDEAVHGARTAGHVRQRRRAVQRFGWRQLQ